MEKYPKEIMIKDGTRVTLRLMEKDDVTKLLDFFRALPEEDRRFLKEDVTQEEVVRRWADELNYDRIFPIVAEVEGKIVGDATLHRPLYGWSKHVGEIRMVVAKEYQRKGLGTALARELYRYALDKGVEKIVAQVMEGQLGAIKAFERLGFKKEATLKEHVTDLEGKKRGLIIMANHVEDLWRRMEELYSAEEFTATIRQ